MASCRYPRAAASAGLVAGLLLSCPGGDVRAEVYKTPETFVREAQDGASPPVAKAIFLTRDLQREVAAVMGHPYKALRIRYWRQADETIWVLDEIGKEEAITIGFVVAGGAIRDTEVLEFRESRGWEIRFPAFTRQFLGARLAAGDELDRPIDGITGATLSVGAYHRLARLALLLHQRVVAGGG